MWFSGTSRLMMNPAWPNDMRRRLFLKGAGGIAGFFLWPRLVAAADVVEIAMQGSPNGARVWFDPVGLLIRPGTTLRWVNKDKGNSHTATAFHPDNDDHPLRIPKGAEPFDSGYLLPGESFKVTLDTPGVYDYYCIPHELAGMVGRIVVADEGQEDFAEYGEDGLSDNVLNAFPAVADILAEQRISRSD